MYFLFNLSHNVKSCGHFCQILSFFMMSTYQIWSCNVTQETNFEKLLCFPNSAFNIGKSYKIFNRKALYFRSYRPKTLWGGVQNTPSAFRVKGFSNCNKVLTLMKSKSQNINLVARFFYLLFLALYNALKYG